MYTERFVFPGSPSFTSVSGLNQTIDSLSLLRKHYATATN